MLGLDISKRDDLQRLNILSVPDVSAYDELLAYIYSMAVKMADPSVAAEYPYQNRVSGNDLGALFVKMAQMYPQIGDFLRDYYGNTLHLPIPQALQAGFGGKGVLSPAGDAVLDEKVTVTKGDSHFFSHFFSM